MKRVHDAISWWNRLLTLFGAGRRTRDIDDEIAFHLAMRQAEHERAGLAPEIARRTVARQFGNVTALKEQTREMWKFPSFESLVRDIRYAFRTLRRAPGFALVAVLVLAIGIGATTAMFSLVDTMLLRGLPYPQADRLVVLIGNVQRVGGVERRGNSYPDHLDWRARARSFDDLAAYTPLNMTLQGADEPERIPSEAVSPPYFLYLPYVDRATQGVIVRTRVDPSSLASAVRAAIRDGNASILSFNAQTLADVVAQQSSASRFTSWLLSVFAATALVLSVVGLYGVMSYLVAQRTREFGIRLALGASRVEIVRRVLRDGMWRVAIGAAIGLVATTGLARVLAGLIYGVGTFDISSLLAVVMLVVVAIAACGVPALRATRVDPAIALRSE